ncbi:MAG TPA: DUF4231 domain-containing protein [Verrucomicrobiae bacterium]|nr:DUF4231 domain-containing protein [Verrucomicrobiae bacterium]
MIETGWDEYRGWAARARQLQANLRKWNVASLVCIVAAAIFGGFAVQLKDTDPWGSALAAAAAIAAAIAPVIGREIMSSGVEKKWIRARALAEAIKSQCYRVAAGLPPFDGGDSGERFIAWRDDVTRIAPAEGLIPLEDPVPAEGDKRRPVSGMDVGWYLENRVVNQQGYYNKGRREHEAAAGRLRLLNIGAAVVAAILAALGASKIAGNSGIEFAAWAGVFVTISAAILAVGLLDRRASLAAQYGAMAIALGRLKEWQAATRSDLKALVDRTESLLTAEHAAWAQSMAQAKLEPKPDAKSESKAKPGSPKS